ncbi:dihydrofolate reductase family protein [Marisediminicola senii]|uniref:dihydrofolate reductase family protein n=1 Tax=Marisediminicola senii TaxID=2711233 RepID=UPI0013EC08F0|nr:dihydrofolate reductase family protein [Marisediminicola senii]
MRVHRLFPASTEVIDADDDGARDALARRYETPAPAWLRLTLIASVSGSAAGADGTSDTLTNPVDRMILGAIRSRADVVLVGAQTVRHEGYVLPRGRAMAVITMSGNLDGHRFGAPPEPGQLIVICPPAAAERAAESLGVPATVVTVDAVDGGIPMHTAIAELHSRGLTSIVCEGGPALAAQLLDAGAVDELCLATSPMVTASRVALFGDRAIADSRLRLDQLLMDDSSTLYARWRVIRHGDD